MQLRQTLKTVIPRGKRFFRRLRYPNRIFAYAVIKLAYYARWVKVPVTPVAVDIEPINICNFRCEHCQVTHWNKEKAQLDIDKFRRIVERLPNLNEVNLQGMGEPLLNKQHIDLLREGERRGLTMRFHSNASACTEAKAKELLELTNTSITFSIDAGCAETFERVRPGSHFAQIYRNVRYLTSQRNGKKTPSVSGWTVLTTENIRELPQIVKLCGELGLDRVTLQPFLTDWGKDKMTDYVSTVQVASLEKAYEQLLHEAHQAADAAKIDLLVVHNVYSKKNPCPWPWQNAYIAANGDVVPCCIIADADVAKMGNVLEKPFAEIWNGTEYTTLRSRLRSHDLPSYCRGCYTDAPATNQFAPQAVSAPAQTAEEAQPAAGAA